jgi:hypothetical protein
MQAFEKQSGIDHISSVSSKEEEPLLLHFERTLREQRTDPFERQKNPEEREVIENILRDMPSFVWSFGGKPVRNPTEANIHLIDTEKLSREQRKAIGAADVGGVYDIETQSAIVLPKEHSPLTTAQRIVHEVLHLNAFTSLSAREKPPPGRTPLAEVEGKKLFPRRIGFSVFDVRQTRRFFRNIDEAVIEELSARFDRQYFANIPALAQEIEKREQVRTRVGAGAEEIAAVTTVQEENGLWKTSIENWRYPKERGELRKLIGEIYQAHPGRFRSEEDVFSVFAKATLTGRLLEVARLVEATHGKGSFRRLGEET